MANLLPFARNTSTGYNAALSSTDILVDSSNNVVVPVSDKLLTSATTSISLTATGTTNLFTVPSGQTCVVTKVVLYCTTGTGITVDAVAGVGVAAGEDDVFAPVTLTNFRSTGNTYTFNASGKAVSIAAGSIVKLGVDTAATGTTLTVSAFVFGYYVGETTSQGGGLAVTGQTERCYAYRASYALPNPGAYNYIPFNAEAYDTNDMHDNITNNGRIYLKTTGLWLVTVDVLITNGGENYLGIYVERNGPSGAIASTGYSNFDGNPTYYRKTLSVPFLVDTTTSWLELVIVPTSGQTLTYGALIAAKIQSY